VYFAVLCLDVSSDWFMHKTGLLTATCFFQANGSGWYLCSLHFVLSAVGLSASND